MNVVGHDAMALFLTPRSMCKPSLVLSLAGGGRVNGGASELPPRGQWRTRRRTRKMASKAPMPAHSMRNRLLARPCHSVSPRSHPSTRARTLSNLWPNLPTLVLSSCSLVSSAPIRSAWAPNVLSKPEIWALKVWAREEVESEKCTWCWLVAELRVAKEDIKVWRAEMCSSNE